MPQVDVTIFYMCCMCSRCSGFVPFWELMLLWVSSLLRVVLAADLVGAPRSAWPGGNRGEGSELPAVCWGFILV